MGLFSHPLGLFPLPLCFCSFSWSLFLHFGILSLVLVLLSLSGLLSHLLGALFSLLGSSFSPFWSLFHLLGLLSPFQGILSLLFRLFAPCFGTVAPSATPKTAKSPQAPSHSVTHLGEVGRPPGLGQCPRVPRPRPVGPSQVVAGGTVVVTAEATERRPRFPGHLHCRPRGAQFHQKSRDSADPQGPVRLRDGQRSRELQGQGGGDPVELENTELGEKGGFGVIQG